MDNTFNKDFGFQLEAQTFNNIGETPISNLTKVIQSDMFNSSPSDYFLKEQLNETIKEEIKNNCLILLGNNSEEIRKQASLTVAGIFGLTLRDKKWKELIDILIRACSNSNSIHQTSAKSIFRKSHLNF